jgi:hypothetical protein
MALSLDRPYSLIEIIISIPLARSNTPRRAFLFQAHILVPKSKPIMRNKQYRTGQERDRAAKQLLAGGSGEHQQRHDYCE